MKLELELIRILDTIEKHGSFEAAANELHKVRSALTYQIQKYEELLEIQIFDRSGHRAQLTKAGRVLLEQGRQLLQLGYQIEKSAKQAATGWETEIRIAYDEVLATSALFELIRQFHVQCSNVSISLIGERLGGTAEALINHRADIAIGISQPLPNKRDFVVEPLGTVDFVFVVSPTHPLALEQEPIPTVLIEQYPAIVASDSARQLLPLTTGLLPEQTKLTFSNMDMKYRAQLLGLGVGFLPYHLVKQEIERGSLIVKQVEREKAQSYYYIAWSRLKTGKAQQWLIEKISNTSFQKKLFL
jgi:molybdate transport repressor ModE-like protein